MAIRLTEVEYELFQQVHPSEYLRHATLDMNNFKYSLMSDSNQKQKHNNSLPVVEDSQAATAAPAETAEAKGKKQKCPNVSTKSVQDLIVRYKEVSSWIKKLIQSQPTSEKRTAIILSAIRCAITCWNIGNFNSSR